MSDQRTREAEQGFRGGEPDEEPVKQHPSEPEAGEGYAYIDEAGTITEAAYKALLPADRLVAEGQEGELVIFDGDDVAQALRQFKIAGGGSPSRRKQLKAMRVVMMYALRIAAINLEIKPDAGMDAGAGPSTAAGA